MFKVANISIILLFVFNVSKVYAESGCLRVKGEYFYAKPFLENTNYVASTDGAPIGYDTQNVPGYGSGYGGEIDYGLCNGDWFSLSGSYFKKQSTKTAVNPPGNLLTGFIVPTTGISFFLSGTLLAASSTVDLQFYDIDFLYNKSLYYCGCFGVDLKTGVQFVDVKFDERIVYSQLGGIGLTLSDFKNTSRFAGVGPEVGLDVHWRFWQNRTGFFTLNGSLSGALLASYTKARHAGGYGFFAGAFANEPNLRRANWTLNPAWLVQWGLNYMFTCLCLKPSVEVGVRLEQYYHAVEKLFFSPPVVTNDSFVNEAEYSNLGFFAPYVSVQITF